eukprot:gene13366-15393_t
MIPFVHSQSFHLHLLAFKVIGSFGASNESGRFKSTFLATEAVASGAQTINQLANNRTAQQFQLLQRLMHIAQSAKTGLSVVRATSEGAALALALAVQGANVVQLEYFVSLKMYPFLFQLLDIFQYNLRVVMEGIKALTAMVLKVGNIRDVQQRAVTRYCFDVSDGWFCLFNWASTSTNGDKLSAVEREDWQEIVGALNNLILHARNLDLLPHGLLKESVCNVGGTL